MKLVDGSLGNVPVRSDNGQGGFTVASENPVYILGNYNSNCAAAGNPGCTPGNPNYDLSRNPGGANPVHAAAGVIADAVTMLSNNWSDLASLNSPSNDAGRPAVTSYYRVAVSGGKNINFPTQALAWKIGDWGTDGGLHNFLRQLENWNPAAGQQTLNYKGSMASLYYATYSTGTDKNGGNTTYDPAIRNYTFDLLFTQPQNLPPGTPMFRDIDNLSYRQSFTPRLPALLSRTAASSQPRSCRAGSGLFHMQSTDAGAPSRPAATFPQLVSIFPRDQSQLRRINLAKISALFWDVGGVLLSDAWDREQRQRTLKLFGLEEDEVEFESRHEMLVSSFERGKITLQDYLERTIFYRPRSFTIEAFTQHMLSLSQP